MPPAASYRFRLPAGRRPRLVVAASAALGVWAVAMAVEVAVGRAVGGRGVPASSVAASVAELSQGAPARFVETAREASAKFEDDSPLSGVETLATAELLADLGDSTDAASPATTPYVPVELVQLDAQPFAYRGRLVSLDGIVRRASRRPLGDEAGTTVWELWLFDEGRPCTVWASALPRGFPVGEKLQTPVTIGGVLLKRRAYRAVDDIRLAPLVLATEIAWAPPAAPPGDQPSERSLAVLVVTAAAALAAAAFLGVRFLSRSPRRPSPGPRDFSGVVAPQRTPSWPGGDET